MMRQAVPGLFGAIAPQPPEVQAPTVAPGLFSTPEDGHSATIRQAQSNVQSFLADPVKAMTYTTLNGTAGQGPDAAQRSLAGLGGPLDHRGGFSDNSGLADVASRETSLGGFLASTLGNMAAVANPAPFGLAGIGLGIANNSRSLGMKGLFDAIRDSLGLGDGGSGDFGGQHGDAGIGGGGIGNGGGQSTSDGSQGDTA
ncbi:hypothetical protein Sp245p_03525 [Azospirillum baldaniorum]|uniref:Uncharacterized protein n=1 Tax=Azospirillum baldaniorum TaxID=1064539 RepID=A0A9P1NN65_9PROT|nr:hypothetical protein [Azospirillum baldaniorum]AWJ88924.1 hypothetical protein Sp245p_03525 [Azospirillum baldaniorum]TWA73364.1 hypothetical protein FBZ85_11656 [Azospirillum brasilense]CCC99363.1 protein of unknown function [Azospirillum baldaniorum]